MSTRDDGRGHWPAGERRNPDEVGWARVRLSLTRLIDDHYERGYISARQLAAEVGVSDRTVRRWLAGEDRPDPETQEVVAEWVAERRADLKGRR